jgi:hypothetical protein
MNASPRPWSTYRWLSYAAWCAGIGLALGSVNWPMTFRAPIAVLSALVHVLLYTPVVTWLRSKPTGKLARAIVCKRTAARGRR